MDQRANPWRLEGSKGEGGGEESVCPFELGDLEEDLWRCCGLGLLLKKKRITMADATAPIKVADEIKVASLEFIASPFTNNGNWRERGENVGGKW